MTTEPGAAEAAAAPHQPQPASTAAVWGALVTVYVVWGSTYLGIAVLVQSAPPQVSMGLRFVLAALVMATALAVIKGPRVLRVTRRELASAGTIGALLLGLGMGNLTLAERYVPSGVAALIVAVVPLWAVLLRVVTGDRPAALTWLGVVVGLVGTAVLVAPGSTAGVGGASSTQTTLWSGLIVLGTMAWALGSFLAPRLPTPGNPFVLSAYEMLLGGGVLVVLGTVRGERLTSDTLAGVTPASWWAFGYLVVVGSLFAFTAYVWVLDHAPLSLVMTYAYVNPVVAVALGALVLDEPVTAGVLVGGAIVVVGVLLVVSAERLRPSR